ncbi:hypothetical protein [Arenimonas aestuarii]
MKASPLKIDGLEYPVVSVRATPGVEPPEIDEPLIPKVHASVGFSIDGRHFAIINAKQTKRSKHYTFELEAFTGFEIDIEACKACYMSGWSPNMLAVNVARLLYSGVREMLASISSRAPYGPVTLPSTTLGPEDVHIEFQPRNKRDEILMEFFNFSAEKIEELNKRLAAKSIDSGATSPTKSAAKKTPQK